MHLATLLRLALLVFTAMTIIVIGDTAGKLLTRAGIDPILIAWSRFFIAALVILPFSGLSRKELPSLWSWRVLLRAALITCGISCILTALKTEPIANVFGAFFIGPVVSYILAIVFLGERPSLRRGLLLGLGFLGVMLVVKPGFDTSIGIFFALAAGCFYGAFLAATRAIAPDYRPRFLLISQLLIGAMLLTPFGLTSTMPMLDARIVVLFLISALGSAAGNYLLVVANKRAEASLIAPLIYSQLISATVIGVAVFDEWPDIYSLFGLTLIAISGFASLLQARQS